jgi:hypothetical protein
LGGKGARDGSEGPARNGSQSRARSGLSLALVVIASLLALVGGVTLYLREEVLDSHAFADRAVEAVHQPTVQHVLARRITVQLIEPGFPDLIAGRPLISSAVRVAVTSKPFARVIRLAALHGHRLLFQRNGGNAVFDIADAGKVISSALQNISPKLAREIPKRTEAVLLTLRKRNFASKTLRLSETVRLLGFVLPPVAIALLAIAIAIAPDRRRALTRAAVAIGVTGIAFAIAFVLFRRYYVSTVRGVNEISTSEARAAVDELWGALLGDLLAWILAITAVAWVVAAASSTVLAPYSPSVGLRRLWAAAPRPVSPRARTLRGALVLALGVLVILKPTLALRIAAVLGGGLLVYVGMGELLSATAPAQPLTRRRPAVSRRRVLALAGTVAACAAAFGIAFALVGSSSNVQAKTLASCNGYAQLCSHRLDEVVFAGTHNSMSAADTPGWLIANQDRNVARQLNDGVRAFKISTHYGVQTQTGQVYTDIAAAGDRVNRVAERLDHPSRAALQRFSRSLHRGGTGGKRDIWLCHSLCELGATGMVHYLSVIRRFLELNPGNVIVLFDEDYVSEPNLRRAFKRAGLFNRLATLERGQPLPTLGELIRSRHNIVVFAQEPTSGAFQWNADSVTWLQDTPLKAVKPSQFTCKLYRGYSTNPLLVMNDWADIFPPRPSPNVPLVQKDFIIKRAHECAVERGKIPNLIMTDYYNRGDVVGAVSELNGVATVKPASINEVEFG